MEADPLEQPLGERESKSNPIDHPKENRKAPGTGLQNEQIHISTELLGELRHYERERCYKGTPMETNIFRQRCSSFPNNPCPNNIGQGTYVS